MPTKRIFDLVVVTGLALHGAVGLGRMAARRWQRETTGVVAGLGDVVAVLA